MVDVNNELVGIVGALTEKNEKDKFYVLEERGGSEKLQTREWEKRQWMGGERRRERTGDMRMD